MTRFRHSQYSHAPRKEIVTLKTQKSKQGKGLFLTRLSLCRDRAFLFTLFDVLGFALLLIRQLHARFSVRVAPLDASNNAFKVTASSLGANHDGEKDGRGDDGRGDSHDGTVRLGLVAASDGDEGILRDGIDKLGRGRRDHVAQLVGDSREGRPESSRRQLVEVDGDHAPSALDEELHEEARGAQRRLALGENPGGDQDGGHERRAHHGAAATKKLAEIADDGAAHDGANLHHDGGARRPGVVQLLLLQHEGGVRVLRRVRVVVEPRHEDDAVDAHLPLLGEHRPRFAPESPWRRGLLAGLFGVQKLLRFGEEEAEQADANG